MSQWYYVDMVKNDRVGPVTIQEIEKLFSTGVLNVNSYVWTKGFKNWELIKNVEVLGHLKNEVKKKSELTPAKSMESDLREIENAEENDEVENLHSHQPDSDNQTLNHQKSKNLKTNLPQLNWNNFDQNQRLFHIKTGLDRSDQHGSEYGPYSFKELKSLFNENRINQKTLTYFPGTLDWIYLGEIPQFEKHFGEKFLKSESEKRHDLRKPFIARMFFHDNEQLFEGVCRDISIGGMQVLVGDFPGSVGDEISLNVHPDNSDFGFVANGKIVRKLDGDLGFSFRFTHLSNEAKVAIGQYLETEME
jgi:hypothetical protein